MGWLDGESRKDVVLWWGDLLEIEDYWLVGYFVWL